MSAAVRAFDCVSHQLEELKVLHDTREEELFEAVKQIDSLKQDVRSQVLHV